MSNFNKYYDTFLQNALKQFEYKVKFINDPKEYIGIPIASSFARPSEDETFSFQIIEPGFENKCLKKKFIEIEYVKELEK